MSGAARRIGHRLIRSNLVVALATMLASLSGLAIALGVPLILPADRYAVFATLWALGQFLASLGFEWMRFGVLRFGVGADPAETLRLRAALWHLYRSGLGATLVLAAGVGAAAVWGGAPMRALALVLVFAALNGAFDGYQALQRAEGRNAAFSAGRILRSCLGFLGAMAGAALFGTAEAGLAGLALSFPLALLLSRPSRPALPGAHTSLRPALRRLFRFGLYAALTTNLALLLPALYRLGAIRAFGASDAAGLVLAFDLSQKAIAVVGLAVNVVVMQSSIRVAEFQNDARAQAHQAGRQFGLTLAMVAPATVGFALIGAPLAQLAVAAEMRPTFLAVLMPATLTAGLLAFRMFSIDPLFVVRQQTFSGVIGAAVTVLATAAALLIPGLTIVQLGWALVLAMALGVAVSLTLLVRGGKILWPWADKGAIAAGCVVMSAVAQLVPTSSALVQLLATIGLGALSYAAVVWLANTGGLRAALWQRPGA